MTFETQPALDPGLVDRVKGIIMRPKLEWPVIAAEHATVQGLFQRYAMILAAIGPLCGLIGSALFGFPAGIVGAILTAIFGYIVALVSVYVLGLIIDALAPSFASEKNIVQSMKLAVYSMTPAWIAGVLGLLPFLAPLAIIAAFYGIYLMFLGLRPLKHTQEDKQILYTVVVVLIGIAIQVVLGLLLTAALLPMVIASAALS